MTKELAETVIHDLETDSFLNRAIITTEKKTEIEPMKLILELRDFDKIDARRLVAICERHDLHFSIESTKIANRVKIIMDKYSRTPNKNE